MKENLKYRSRLQTYKDILILGEICFPRFQLLENPFLSPTHVDIEKHMELG